MDNITIRISCDLTKELEEKIRFVSNEILFNFDGVHSISYFNETMNKRNTNKKYIPHNFKEENKMAQISIDNGHSFITAGEALSVLRLSTMIPYMDDKIREATHIEVSPCSEKVFLEKYLELADEDLIIG